MNRLDSPSVLCPSARAKEGAALIGIVMGDGRVAFSADRLVVNPGFLENASAGRAPEKRFRFGDLCVQSGCRQWTGTRCGVIDEVLEHVPEEEKSRELPACSIRPQCRWYNQVGAEACRVCSLVVTDCLDEAEPTVAALNET